MISPSGLGFVGGGDGERLCCLDGLGEAGLGFWVWNLFFVDLPANIYILYIHTLDVEQINILSYEMQ